MTMKYVYLFVLFLVFTSCTTGSAINAVSTPSRCSDTDGGKVFDVAGTVIMKTNNGNSFSYPDKCEENSLKEYYCDKGNYANFVLKECDCQISVCT